MTYFIHYTGWNTRWDKWVPPNDLLKDTAETKQLVKVIKEKKKGMKAKQGVCEERSDEGGAMIEATMLHEQLLLCSRFARRTPPYLPD